MNMLGTQDVAKIRHFIQVFLRDRLSEMIHMEKTPVVMAALTDQVRDVYMKISGIHPAPEDIDIIRKHTATETTYEIVFKNPPPTVSMFLHGPLGYVSGDREFETW